MSTKKITYEKKAPFQTDENIPEINQVTSDNLNEIKDVVNINADELESKQPKEQGKGLSTNDFTNEFKNKLENLNNYDDKEITSKVTNLEENVVNIQKKQTTQNKDIEDLKTDNKKNKTDLQTIKQEQQDQNLKIESNTTENKDNTELLNQIMGLLPSTKGDGEYVTLDDTAEMKFKKFEVQGNRKQETRSGKNKFDGNFSQGYDSSGKITSSSQFICNTNLINVEQNKKYTISNNLNLKIASIAYYKDNEFVNFKSNIASNTINILENVNQIRLNLYREQGLSVSEINMCQLEEGEIATDYEQYGASPSLEFPSKIRNVGDNVNWFNKDGNVITSIDTEKTPIETGVKVTVKAKGTAKCCVMKLGGSELLGKTFILHGEARFSGKNDGLIGLYFGTESNFNIQWITDTNYLTIESSKFKRVFTVPDTFPEGSDTIYILLYANARSTETKVGDYVEYRDFKIEEGTQATAYSPYNCGNAEITVGNKNLANTKIIKNTDIITVNEDGSLTLANNSNTAGYTSTGKKLNELCKGLKVGDTAYLKLITTSTNNIYLQGKANQYWLGNNSNKITKDMLEDTVIVYGGYNKTDKLQIQITKNTIGDYAQNKQQTIVFPFTEGQRLYKGDYLAEDGIHHTRKKIVLDGTEAWGQYNRGTTDFFGVALKVSDIKSGQTIMCNKLIEDGSKIYSTNGEAVGCLTDNYLYICIKRVRIGATINTAFEECLELFKQYLTNCYNKGEPFIIEYGLINEENEPYTPEQQEAHNQLKKLHSYNEQTNIFSKDEINPIFNVEAIKNLNVAVLEQTTKES